MLLPNILEQATNLLGPPFLSETWTWHVITCLQQMKISYWTSGCNASVWFKHRLLCLRDLRNIWVCMYMYLSQNSHSGDGRPES